MKIVFARDYQDMSRKAANIVSAQVLLKNDCVLGLATGGTPVGLYRQLIEWQKKDDISFRDVRSVNLDEYVGLPPEHAQSYRYYMNRTFFDHIDIDKANTFVPSGLFQDAAAECAAYDRRIEAFGGIDLQLLGIGNNGHIGFNEPAEDFQMNTHVVDLMESTRRANARFFGGDLEAVPRQAITMGLLHIMQAKRVLLVADGDQKREVLLRALRGPVTPKLPASILQLHRELTVVCSCTPF